MKKIYGEKGFPNKHENDKGILLINIFRSQKLSLRVYSTFSKTDDVITCLFVRKTICEDENISILIS